jgi:GT2 family glycosyltransferase
VARRPPLKKLELSVVVLTRDSTRTLRDVLEAIRSSELERYAYEIIVVDDASADGSAAVAARYADTVVKLTGREAGPAYGRNRGAEIARGDVIAFIDGDVVVRPDTLRRMLSTMAENPQITALAASRDSSCAPNFISQYWNLLLSFGEQREGRKAAQFAAGCGMVRRAEFLTAGMYDEWRFNTGCMETVELGERLSRAGYGVVLSPQMKVIHLKRWDLPSVAREVWHRSRVLARSLGYQRMSAAAPSEVVFTLSRALTPAVALLGTVTLAAAFVPAAHTVGKIGVGLAALLVANLPVHRFYARSRGVLFTIVSAPLHIFVQLVSASALCTGWILRDVFGDVSPDATIQAYAEVGLEIWPPVPRKL